MDKSVKQHKIRSLDEWNEHKQEDQTDLVNEKMEALLSNPTSWYITFDDLNNQGRSLLFQKLKEFFNSHIDHLPITKKYRFVFKVGKDKSKSKPFTPEVYR